MSKFSTKTLNNSEETSLSEEVQHQLAQLKAENQFLKNQLEEISQGGIKILFSGKANAQRVVRKVKPRTLREIKSLSIDNEEGQTKNLVIEGDNLLAMATLYQYHGKIDLIIADPPYNTGKDFRYNDKWDEDINDEGIGDLIKADDPSRHTKWMKFMLPRLIMMREMLKPSGVLAICIDYRELFNLGKMLDEVFGEKNRLGIINWQKTFALKNDSKHLSNSTEYVLVYAKSEERAITGKLERSEEQKNRYQNPDNDPKGNWAAHSSSAKTPFPSMVYGIQNPFTGKIVYPPLASGWRAGKSEFKKMLEEWGSEYEEKDLQDGCFPALVLKGANETSNVIEAKKRAKKRLETMPWPKLLFGKDGKGKPAIKRYFIDIQQGIISTTFWASEEYNLPLEIGDVSWEHSQSGHNQGATNELYNRVGREQQLDGIKPLKLFQKIIQLWCPPNGLVLDPFAGSGTTGEAVLQLNKETNANRQFILIELGNPETDDSYCRTLLQKRLAATITGKWADKKEHEPLRSGFTFYRLNKTIDAQTLLEMKKDDLIDAILASQMESQWTKLENYPCLFAKNSENEGIFLIWNGNSKSQLTQEIYYQIVQEAQQANLSSEKYIIYARLCSFRSENLEFKQIPNEILASFRIFD